MEVPTVWKMYHGGEMNNMSDWNFSFFYLSEWSLEEDLQDLPCFNILYQAYSNCEYMR